MRTPLQLTIDFAIFGENYLAFYWTGQQALASHWPEEFANSMPAYLANGQTYAVWN
jgi:hypothetical protein